MTAHQPAARSRSTVSNIILIATAVVGGAAIVAAGTTAAAQAVTENSRGAFATSGGIAGSDDITAIELDIDAADVTILFDDVEEVSLDTTGRDSDKWRVQRTGDTMHISTPGDRFGFCFGLCNMERTATVRLPKGLEGINLTVDLDAGAVVADGKFGDVDIDGDAGATTVRGAASSLSAEVEAGTLDAELDGVRKASLGLDAGRGKVTLTGRAPEQVQAEVSTGALDVVLPDASYRVQSDVTFGDFVNELRTDDESRHRVEAELEAGSLTLRAGAKTG